MSELFTRMNINLFNLNTNVTTANAHPNDLSPEMRTYYEDRLIDNAEPKLVHDQFGDKYPIPANNGKTIQFRKFTPYPKALTALTEGVTPDGRSLDLTTKSATVAQYGDYTTISDLLEMTAVDPVQVQATKLHGAQAGRTLDTITREVLHGGTNVMYAPTVSSGAETEVVSRHGLGATSQLSPKVIFRAVAKLEEQNAVPIDGNEYVAIIHPNMAADLMMQDGWMDVHKYAKPENIYMGEIGSLAGCRFVKTTEAKIIGAAINTTVNASTTSATTFVLKDAPSAEGEEYLKDGNTLTVGGETVTIASYNKSTKTVTIDETKSLTAGAAVYSDEVGAGGLSVYPVLFLAANAYGVTELSNGGLQYIVKQKGSAGTSDPLDQRSTTGWKATKVAERLVEEYMLRVECTCTVNPRAKSN